MRKGFRIQDSGFRAALALLALLFASAPAFAAHNAVLTWTPSTDGAANPTAGYSVFKATTSGGEGAPALATAVAPGCTNTTACTYTDTAVTAGQTYYYKLTFVVGTLSSVMSNEATGKIPVAPPTGVTAVGN